MPRITITDDYGQIKLDDTLLPGIYRGMNVSGSVRIKEEEAPGQSSKFKQALGWDDLQVDISLILPNDEESTPDEKLKQVVQTFRKTDKSAKPIAYRITNKHTVAWGLDKVLIKDLRSDDPPDVDYIKVTLSLVEWESPLVKLETRAVQAPMMDRTVNMPSGSGSSDIEDWQKVPDEGTYQDKIEVPDDD